MLKGAMQQGWVSFADETIGQSERVGSWVRRGLPERGNDYAGLTLSGRF